MDKKFKGLKVEVRKVMALYGLTLKSVKAIKGGIINSSFLVIDQNRKNYVLKAYCHAAHKDNEILNELQIMTMFRQKGIPTPTIIENLKHQDLTKFNDLNNKSWSIVLLDFVRGHQLKSNEYDLVTEFAMFQSRMHELGRLIKPPLNPSVSFKKIINWLKRETIKAEKKIDNKILRLEFKEIIKNILDEVKRSEREIISLSWGYVHLDYDSDNVIVSGKHISGILDFDDISYQPLILDKAFSLWWWLFFNPLSTHKSILKHYNKGYAGCCKPDITEEKLLSLFIRIRNITLAALLFVNIPKCPDYNSLKKSLIFD